MEMGNFFKRKKEIDTDFYEEWDEAEEYDEEAFYEEDEELFEQEEYYETVEESEAEFEESMAQEAYYEAEADEEYYEEEEYYEDEEYDEEAEDEYYEDEYYEEDDEEEERGFLGGMSLVDKLITFGGAALAIIAIVIAGVFLLNPQEQAVSGEYLAVGNQLSDIDIIGESGLLAVAGQEQGRLQALEDALMSEDSEGQYNESEYSNEVTVGMTLTSIEKDLKIKFVNKDSGKLVGNVPFSVEVTDSNGNTSMWSDDDMDGIIYKKKLTPGQYKVTAIALEGDKYDKYDLPQATTKTEVKSEIVIQKVDVSNEIKDESQINVATEDTAKKDTVVEDYLQDTVTWVESTVVEAAYEEVSKDAIKVPQLPVASTGLFSLRKMFTANANNGVITVSPPDATIMPSPSPTPLLTQGSISLDKSSVVLQKNKTAAVKVTGIGGFLPDQTIAYSVSSSNGSVATASIDSSGNVSISAVADGDATITVAANYAVGGTDATRATAQVSVKVANPKIQLHTLDMTVYATMKDTITVFITDAGVPEDQYRIEASSSNAEVATASVAGRTVTVNGVKQGTAEITVKYIEDGVEVSQVCKVTVLTHPMTDTTSKLVTAETGAQVYVLDGSKYREATYADYYTASKFYVLGAAKYTGWQVQKGKVYFYNASGKKVTGEQVIQGVKYNFSSDGSLVADSGVMGIDVSKWNGKIDWKAVKNSGVSYVIIRCGYRGSSQGALIEDSKFKENIQGAIDAGLKVGVYFFTQAVDNAEALEEASMVLDLVKKYKITYPIFLDVEPSGGRADSLTKEERTAICKTFCETIEKYGYTAGVYANKTWLTNKIDASALSGYKIWLAQYASTPTYTGRYDMWQYKDTGKVSGINGNVDLNMSYLGY